MKENVLFEVSHLRLVRLDDERYRLSVEDTELYDFVEDFLWDNYKIETEDIEFESNGKVNICHYFFQPDFDISLLINALKKIDIKEIERIYKLNN